MFKCKHQHKIPDASNKPSQCRLETFQCWLFYYVLGEAIPKDDGGREKAVLINILLDIKLAELFRVASRCSGISERRIWCYILEILVYKIMNNIDQVEKDTFFKFPNYAATRGHTTSPAKNLPVQTSRHGWSS